jgi:hypothetical protein
MAIRELELHPLALDAVTILDGHLRVLPGEVPQLHPILTCLIQLSGELPYHIVSEHG